MRTKSDHPHPAKRPSPRISFEILSDIGDADADILRELVGQLDPSAAFNLEQLRAALSQNVTTLYAVRRNGHLVGAATSVRFSTPTGTHHRIEDVVIDASARGRHLGRKLMTFVLASLRNTGATRVELTSRPSRIAANALYRALGFKPKATNVYTYALS